jgi:hypothetical protein
MYFDNLPLTGLLVTLPYVVMLRHFSNAKSTSGKKKTLMFNYLEKEACRHGA